MSARHVALLVEDHEPTAAALKEKLAAMGFDVLHASTQEEALALVARGGFCFALLDLQIKRTAQSIDESVEAGERVVLEVRRKYPAYDADLEMHAMPILIMSGYAKDPLFLVQMVKRGADEYLFKSEAREPLKPNLPDARLTERIVNALERSGRKLHAGCAEATRIALAKATDGHTAGGMQHRMRITGMRVTAGNSLRDQVCVGHRQASVPTASFAVLMHLVAARVLRGNGRVTRDEFGGERGAKRLSDLRVTLKDCLDGLELDERDGADFRINQRIDVEIDDAAVEILLHHDNHDVRKLAGLIKAHRAGESAVATGAESDGGAVH